MYLAIFLLEWPNFFMVDTRLLSPNLGAYHCGSSWDFSFLIFSFSSSVIVFDSSKAFSRNSLSSLLQTETNFMPC